MIDGYVDFLLLVMLTLHIHLESWAVLDDQCNRHDVQVWCVEVFQSAGVPSPMPSLGQGW